MNNEKKRQPVNKELEKEKLIIENEVNKTRQEMAVALNQFEVVTDPELIDYYTYTYKASIAKYGYLMKKLKKLYSKL